MGQADWKWCAQPTQPPLQPHRSAQHTWLLPFPPSAALPCLSLCHNKDVDFRLWGALPSGASCAFKAPDGAPLYYANYSRSSWDTAPACRGAATDVDAAVSTDALGRLWGWQDDAPCAYRTAAPAAGAANATPTPTPTLTARPAAAPLPAAARPPAAAAVTAARRCPDGSAPVRCLVRPCAFTTCPAGQACVDDFCGGCNARCAACVGGGGAEGEEPFELCLFCFKRRVSFKRTNWLTNPSP